jgi:hypothetical protein
VIQVANYSPNSVSGWLRVKHDGEPIAYPRIYAKHPFLVVPVRMEGEAQVVDVYADKLAPGHIEKIDGPSGDSASWTPPKLPTPQDVVQQFGGLPSLGAREFVLVSAQVEGAAIVAHFRVVANSWVADFRLRYYPDMPAVVHGELAVTCTAERAVGPMILWWGMAGVRQLWGWERMIDFDLAHGQSKRIPLTLLFADHLRGDQYASAGALIEGQIVGHGITRLWADPSLPAVPGFQARAWHWRNMTATIHALRTGTAPPIGPAANSSVSGEQEDQLLHVGTEAMQPDGIGCERVRLLAAHCLGMRPIHFLEADGSPLKLNRPGLHMWDGRPLWRISDDKLGATREMRPEDFRGWWGPDSQHFLAQTLLAAARLNASPMLQDQLGHWCRAYLYGRSANPAVSTSGIFSSRGMAYEAIFAVEVRRTLADQSLANAVVQRFRDRWVNVIEPYLARMPRGIAYIHRDDPRLGAGEWTITWQNALCAGGLDLAGRFFDMPILRQFAREIAEHIVQNAWMDFGGFVTAPVMPVGQTDSPIDPTQALRAVHEDAGIPMVSLQTDAPPGLYSPSFNHYAMPLAVHVVLRNDTLRDKARAIWNHLLASTDPKARRWMPGLD